VTFPTRRAPALAAAAAGLALFAAACGSDSSSSDTTAAPTTTAAQTTAPAATNDVAVVLKEYTLTPTPAKAKAGEVTFSIANQGQLKHEFVVIKTPKPAGDLLKGAEADEAGAVGEDGNIPPGKKATLKLKLSAGHYALICNLPGHYKAGQYANFDVS
jgi:uncharacterized cupredoxin-like copper-binding protein